MNISFHVFGSRSITGESLLPLLLRYYPSCSLFLYSRSDFNNYYFVDFSRPSLFRFPSSDTSSCRIVISLLPSWIFSNFLQSLDTVVRSSISCVVSLSSTSYLTKRFSFNSFDKSLSNCLYKSIQSLKSFCDSSDISFVSIQPSLIYGITNSYSDHNISTILQILTYLPFICLPNNSGLRQPIHCSQLASVICHQISLFVEQYSVNSSSSFNHISSIIDVGGDSVLSYYDLIISLQKSLPYSHPARYCLVFRIPDRLFVFLASFVLLFSFKSYESVLRVFSDLSGFSSASSEIDSNISSFPVFPFYRL